VSGPPEAIVVFAAAPVEPGPRLRARLAELNRPYVVAADGGAATALAFGFTPDVVVGDLDSIDAASLAELRRRGVPIETHPRDKDATDGQLAIERSLLVHPRLIWLLGFSGGPRLDQAMANVLLLTRVDTPTLLLDACNECRVVRPNLDYHWRPDADEIISLIPLGGDAAGVRTQGLRWQLKGEQLSLGSTRGVSNEPVATEVRVSVQRGLLLVTRHFPTDGL
jgi:thiamine pyrophosphokinase